MLLNLHMILVSAIFFGFITGSALLALFRHGASLGGIGIVAMWLQDKTGLQTHHLEQLGSWGNAHRDPRGWSATHVYMALIPAPEAVDASAQWHTLAQVADTPLAFDHRELLSAALSRLRSKVEYTSLPAFLLPEPFTLPQLQQVYEAVLGRELDKSAFRKRMLDGDFLQEVGPVEGTGPRKPMAYRIRNREHTTIVPRTFRFGEGG